MENVIRLIGLLLLFALPFDVAAKDDKLPTYEIEGAGIGTQGTYLVKVTVVSKKKSVDAAVISRCAVHGVLFRGFSSAEHRQSQRPLAGSPAVEAQHQDFFNTFFSSEGSASGYASAVDGSQTVVKSGKQYRVSNIMVVNKDQLRRDLEAAGVISGLSTGF